MEILQSADAFFPFREIVSKRRIIAIRINAGGVPTYHCFAGGVLRVEIETLLSTREKTNNFSFQSENIRHSWDAFKPPAENWKIETEMAEKNLRGKVKKGNQESESLDRTEKVKV